MRIDADMADRNGIAAVVHVTARQLGAVRAELVRRAIQLMLLGSAATTGQSGAGVATAGILSRSWNLIQSEISMALPAIVVGLALGLAFYHRINGLASGEPSIFYR